MLRVLITTALVATALAISGCTGSVRLGSSVHAVTVSALVG